jgi:hypothetical protein
VNDINTQWHTLETADGSMRLYAAYPEQPAKRAIVVLQEAFGVNEHIQDVTRRFAERGFLAVAPDLFHRNGVAELRYDQHAEAMPLIGAIGPDAIITDISTGLGPDPCLPRRTHPREVNRTWVDPGRRAHDHGSAPAHLVSGGVIRCGASARRTQSRPPRGRRLPIVSGLVTSALDVASYHYGPWRVRRERA